MKIVICDDNRTELDTYAATLNQLAQKHEIDLELCLYERGNQLLFDFQDMKFFADIIFLDIRMPGISGVEVAQRLREFDYKNEIIFITVSKEYMLKAFDVGALHYIVKGETAPGEFEKIFLRAVKAAEEKERQYVLFTGGGESRNIPVSSIKYFEIYKKVITVYYDNTSFEFFSSLDKLEKQLQTQGFFRIHRSFLVSLSQIERLTAKEITLRDGKRLAVSRKYYAGLKSILASSAISK